MEDGMKKYELTTNTKLIFGRTLFQIKALVSFSDVNAGDIGGWVEKDGNLSHEGNAWVYGNARVYGNALISCDALIFGDARVYGNAEVSGNAWVYGNAEVSGNARVYGNAEVSGNAEVYSNAGCMWFSRVGSENGTLTATRSRDGEILISRGCFLGTIDEFAAAVEKRHGTTKIGDEYRLLIQFIRLRMGQSEVAA